MTETHELYEEWVCYTGERAYVPSKRHEEYAKRGGWWVTAWSGDEDAVQATGYEPVGN